MDIDKIDRSVEIAISKALADPKEVGDRAFTEPELRAFRLGFLSGARYGLRTALNEARSILADEAPERA